MERQPLLRFWGSSWPKHSQGDLNCGRAESTVESEGAVVAELEKR